MLLLSKFITQPIDGLQVIVRPAFLELLPQVPHVGVDEIKIVHHVDVVSPQVLGNGLLGQHPVLVGDEIQQQEVFLLGQVEWGRIDHGDLGHRVDLDLLEDDVVVSRLSREFTLELSSAR